ncbi:MAG: acyltransferase family protein [Rhizobiaceae bacterium]|nr:acyltransferase family protein [Rhizobiaceae bacterium]
MINKTNNDSDSGQWQYRSDIDGLRAIAVIAVIAGHAFETWFPGGFLGVDVFFVISGFVITQSLLPQKRSDAGAFLSAFLLRRIKRLLPALLVCVAITSGVTLLIDPTPAASIQTGMAALLGFSNLSLYFQELDYFAATARYNSFTHTWSLGVEEQFYLLFPVLFWLAMQRSSTSRNTIFTTSIALLAAASFGAFVGFHDSHPVATYYWMGTRFWELGTGVLAALFVHRSGLCFRLPYSRGLAMVLLALLFTLFLVPARLVPWNNLAAVTFVCLLLVIGAFPQNQLPILTNGVARYLGKTSYSLYLWHWPFLTFGLLAPRSFFASKALAIVCAVVAASISYHFVEQPFRRAPLPRRKRNYFAFAVASVGLACLLIAASLDYRKQLLAAIGINHAVIEKALGEGFLPLPESGLSFVHTCAIDGDGRRLKDNTFAACTFPPIPGGDARTLWVMGDSHAGHLQGMLIELRTRYGLGFHLVETPGKRFPNDKDTDFAPRLALYQDARAVWKPGDVVVLSRLYIRRNERMTIHETVPRWLDAVNVLAKDLKAEGLNLMLVGPPPMFDFEDIRACNPSYPLICAKNRAALLKPVAQIHAQIRTIVEENDNVALFETFPHLCPDNEPTCSPADEGFFLFRDRDHLNAQGAARLAPEFYRALSLFER